MVFYNVIISVEAEIKEDFLKWYRDEHIPDMLSTGLFLDVKIDKQLLPKPEGFETFTFQFISEDFGDYERYILKYSEAMRNRFPGRFKGRFKTIRTVTEPTKSTRIVLDK